MDFGQIMIMAPTPNTVDHLLTINTVIVKLNILFYRSLIKNGLDCIHLRIFFIIN